VHVGVRHGISERSFYEDYSLFAMADAAGIVHLTPAGGRRIQLIKRMTCSLAPRASHPLTGSEGMHDKSRKTLAGRVLALRTSGFTKGAGSETRKSTLAAARTDRTRVADGVAGRRCPTDRGEPGRARSRKPPELRGYRRSGCLGELLPCAGQLAGVPGSIAGNSPGHGYIRRSPYEPRHAQSSKSHEHRRGEFVRP
jgi:hypothetical protein